MAVFFQVNVNYYYQIQLQDFINKRNTKQDIVTKYVMIFLNQQHFDNYLKLNSRTCYIKV